MRGKNLMICRLDTSHIIIPQAVALTSETVKSGMCRCTLEKLSNSDIYVTFVNKEIQCCCKVYL